ncbi:MAG: hypothetical protein U5J83_01555 [Bryobacterales bacterium]|nr:hypothetical protein [Bryobacterales bacterium]
MQIRLRIDPQRREEAETFPPDALFRRALIPKHNPVTEFVHPFALYFFCLVMHSQGGKELWESYRRKADDPLAQETHQATGRLSLSFMSSAALHLVGLTLLIPMFDLLATLQPRTARLRAPLITPVMIKVPTRIIVPKGSGENEKDDKGAGKGIDKKPDAGSDSRLMAKSKGVEQPKPSLKAPGERRDVGKPKPPVISDLQVIAENLDLPKILFWSSDTKVPKMPDSVAATAIKPLNLPPPPPDTPEALLRMQPKKLDFKPKLTLDLGAKKVKDDPNAVAKKNALESPDDAVRRQEEMRASVGTGEQAAEGIRLFGGATSKQMKRFLELLPSGQMASLTGESGTTGGTIYSMSNAAAPGAELLRFLPGSAGGRGQGTGGGGTGAGDGVGPGSKGGSSGGGQATMADLLAVLELSEPLRNRTVVHAEDGQFDLMVTQTALSDVFADAKGLLRGARIETVYIQVGSTKEWILQFCESTGPEAAKKKPQENGVFVLDESPADVSAPFPAITVRPPAPVMPKASYVVVHGFIDLKGEFQDLEVVGARFASLLPMLKPSLNKWRFRPASRNGKPVQVEVLLLIPPVTI